MRTGWVHIGLPKTATTAFQDVLFRHSWPLAVPAPFRAFEPKHELVVAAALSGVAGLIDTSKRPDSMAPVAALTPTDLFWRHVPTGWGAQEVARLGHRLDLALSAPEDFIVSVEEFFPVPQFATPLIDRIAPHVDQVKLLVVLRELATWIPSLLSQLVTPRGDDFAGLVSEGLELPDLYPAYRARLGPWVDAVGHHNVVALPYEDAPGGAALLTRIFAQILGAEQSLPPPQSRNLSPSGELTAVTLAAQLSGLSRDKDQARGLAPLLACGAGYGSRRLALSQDCLDRIVAANRSDLEWAEQLLGARLGGAAAPGALELTSIRDLAETGSRLMPYFARYAADQLGLSVPDRGRGISLPELVAHVARLEVLPRLPAGFDATRYLALHPDVAAAGVDPVEHFLRAGGFEGRAY